MRALFFIGAVLLLNLELAPLASAASAYPPKPGTVWNQYSHSSKPVKHKFRKFIRPRTPTPAFELPRAPQVIPMPPIGTPPGNPPPAEPTFEFPRARQITPLPPDTTPPQQFKTPDLAFPLPQSPQINAPPFVFFFPHGFMF